MFDEIVSPVGVTADHQYVYYIRATKTVLFLSAQQHMKMNFLAMAREDVWRRVIGNLDDEVKRRILIKKKVGKSSIGLIDWQALGAELMDLSRSTGRYDPSKVRGRGLWVRSTGQLVYNTGSQLFLVTNGQVETIELPDLPVTREDPHRYIAHPSSLSPFSSEEASTAEIRALFEILELMEWAKGHHEPMLLLGWLACATVLNLVDFRPHLAIIAERGAGKSAVLRVAKLALGENNCFYFEADESTEPGIRQTIGADALPTICDEFETTRQATRDILGFFRIASNPFAGDIAKGSPAGTPQKYTAHTAALVVGTAITFDNPADATRFAMIDLTKRNHTKKERRQLKASISRIHPTLGSRIQRRMINRQGHFAENRETFRDVVLDKGGDDRSADLYGTLLAAYWTVAHDETVTRSQAEQLLGWYDAHRDDDQDHAKCLAHLLTYRWPLYGDTTIGDTLIELIDGTLKNGKRHATDSLQRFGIRYDEATQHVIVANSTPQILACFKGTPWANGHHSRVLKRMGGHNGGNKTERFGTTPSKATWLPLDKVLPDISDGSDEQL
jgi:putative DNA primase/helicase